MRDRVSLNNHKFRSLQVLGEFRSFRFVFVDSLVDTYLKLLRKVNYNFFYTSIFSAIYLVNFNLNINFLHTIGLVIEVTDTVESDLIFFSFVSTIYFELSIYLKIKV